MLDPADAASGPRSRGCHRELEAWRSPGSRVGTMTASAGPRQAIVAEFAIG